MIALNYRDSKPIYQQIRDGFKKLIVSGVMRPGEKLQSVRSLAVELSINPNTIQRALSELESEGYIYSIAGKGSFVSDMNGGASEDLLVSIKRTELLDSIRTLAEELKYIGTDPAEIRALVDEVWKEEDK
ncbi:MAG: GntR family transcriptional regulator [Lachnospiraceae bacterium]|nr:GntR family transcriptional regulator [Lachnospiraceae bacterium]